MLGCILELERIIIKWRTGFSNDYLKNILKYRNWWKYRGIISSDKWRERKKILIDKGVREIYYLWYLWSLFVGVFYESINVNCV